MASDLAALLCGTTPHAECGRGGGVARGVLVGGMEAAEDADWLIRHGVTHVVSVGCPASVPTGAINPAHLLAVRLLDLPEENLLAILPTVLRFLRAAQRASGTVLVHCRFGQSRSVACAVAWLMQRDQLSLLEAARRVAAGRPCLHVNEGFRAQLRVCATPEPGGGADRQRGEGYTTILTRPSQLFERMGARCRLRSGELRASAAARFFVLQCYLGRPAAHRQAFLHAVDGADSPVTPPRLCCHRCRRILARSSSVLFLCNLAAEGAGPVRCQHAPSAAGCGAGSGRGAAVQPPSSALVEPLCWMAPPPGAPSDAGGAPPSADPLAPAAPEAVRDRVQGPAAEKLRCPHCGAKDLRGGRGDLRCLSRVLAAPHYLLSLHERRRAAAPAYTNV